MSTRTGTFPSLAVGGDEVVGRETVGGVRVGARDGGGAVVGRETVGGVRVGARDGGGAGGRVGFGPPPPQRAGGIEERSQTILSIHVFAEETRA